MNSQKQSRLNKIINPKTGKTVIVPMDHGTSEGPMPGLENMEETLTKVKEGGADAVIIHKGIFKRYRNILKDLPVLIHISVATAMTKDLKKVLVATPAEVKELGGTGVSMHVNLGNEYELEMIEDLGRISHECEKLNMPLLVMAYVKELIDGKVVPSQDPDKIKHAARIAFELGADIVKSPYPGSAQNLKPVLEGCPIPVVIAGGAKGSEETMLNSIKECIDIGAAGVSVGRNVFQHEDISGMVKKLRKVVHGI